jgi:Protein of unknown function (DUF1573)
MYMMFRLALSAQVFLYSIQSYAQIIANEDPTLNKGKVEWQWRASVGEVPFDKPVTAEFLVKNNSTQPLIIKEVNTGCHCTVSEFPKDPIEAGQTVKIKATYDAKTEGQFYKIITVVTNFDPERLVALAMIGTVKSKQESANPAVDIKKKNTPSY